MAELLSARKQNLPALPDTAIVSGSGSNDKAVARRCDTAWIFIV